MTGDEVIALARAQFGEATASTVLADTALDFLNSALAELYEDLGQARLKSLLTETTVITTAGQGDVDATWDKIVEVYIDDTPAYPVTRETVDAWDYGTYFQSPIPVFHIDDSHIWIRPDSGTLKVVYLTPPTPITSGTSGDEITDIDEVWHPALADLVTAYMYAQEEDVQQATTYQSMYQQKLGMLLAPQTEEAS